MVHPINSLPALGKEAYKRSFLDVSEEIRIIRCVENNLPREIKQVMENLSSQISVFYDLTFRSHYPLSLDG